MRFSYDFQVMVHGFKSFVRENSLVHSIETKSYALHKSENDMQSEMINMDLSINIQFCTDN